MDREFIDRVLDYFEPYDLVELLGLTTRDITESFPEEIMEARSEIEEFMINGR